MSVYFNKHDICECILYLDIISVRVYTTKCLLYLYILCTYCFDFAGERLAAASWSSSVHFSSAKIDFLAVRWYILKFRHQFFVGKMQFWLYLKPKDQFCQLDTSLCLDLVSQSEICTRRKAVWANFSLLTKTEKNLLSWEHSPLQHVKSVTRCH